MHTCHSCGGNCASCSGCANSLTLTQSELDMLRTFSQIPFLPVARKADDMTPVYLETDNPDNSLILMCLEKKGLIFSEPTKVNTKDGRVHNGSLCYTILPIRDAVERYYEMQLEKARLESARAKAQEKLAKYDARH